MALTLDGTTGISATGNIYGNNIIVTNSLTAGTFTPTVLSSTGNVTGGNLITTGIISATGSLTTGSATINGDLTVTGNASLTGNIVADRIVNGTTEVAIQTTNGNANVTVGGTSNVVVFTTAGINITGISSASGNVTGGNILTGGLISATSTITSAANITGGNLLTAGLLSATGNVTGGNLLTAGLISATSTITSAANITGGNLLTAGLLSAIGNVTGNYLLGNGTFITGLSASKIFNGTSEANIGTSGGNANITIGGTSNVVVVATTGAYVTGLVSATGNVSAPYFIGNGAALTGLSASKIYNGTSEANIGTSGGNANITIGGTSNVFVVASTGIYTTGLSSVTGNITGGNILTAGIMSSTGNAIHGNVLTAGYISATGNLLGNVFTVNLGNTANAIINAGANGVGNIGTATSYFNTVFGKATTAQYADLAELYAADVDYTPGTVLSFGGAKEVTISTVSSDTRVAGVVSTNPAHLMNSVLDSEHRVAVALTGRVPTSVTGTVRKGDMMVSAGNGHAQASAAPAMGTVIGKALQDFDGVSGVIEVVVGRL